MKLRLCSVAFLVLFIWTVPCSARDLTFDDRVKAQEAIERVYYSHQLGATRPFEEMVTRRILEDRVRDYLKRSAALERFWDTPVTGRMLRRELRRIMRQTLMPDRLSEIFAALHNDPVLIQECLARATLADRMARNFFAYDPGIHGAARTEADELRAALAGGTLDPWQEHPRRVEIELNLGTASMISKRDGNDHGRTTIVLTPGRMEHWRERFAGFSGEKIRVEETGEAFQLDFQLESTDSQVRLARYRIEKTGWADWWKSVAPLLDEHSVKTVASPDVSVAAPGVATGHAPGPFNAGSTDGTDAVDDTWDNGVLDDLPEARIYHTAVWTGSLMLVWGGLSCFELEATGGRYDPATDSWTPISTTGAPSARQLHSAVWVGDRMVVWGGQGDGAFVATGGRYDPSTDTWAPTSITGAPSARISHTAVWTGSRMIVWGGEGNGYVELRTGGLYDPAGDSWSPTTTYDAPSARSGHVAVWTGDRMVVWGSSGDTTGGQYDPMADEWTPTSTLGAPAKRGGMSAIWSGIEMVVWGGVSGGNEQNTGGKYDPATDGWVPTSTEGAPSARYSHTAVWTGSRMVVWGGTTSPGNNALDTGGVYDPEHDTWVSTPDTGAPSPRYYHTAAWTGNEMVVWGGDGLFDGYLNTGGRYNPVSDSWTPTAVAGIPLRRSFHTSVWTGNQMLIWGGFGDSRDLDTGGLYDPVTDSWKPTSTEGAPTGRGRHTAVWTGDRMVVWGGYAGGTPSFDTGGLYDPISDAWSPTSTAGAPSGRYKHTAVWTGDRMVIWGGFSSSWPVATGGRYDPVHDSWTPTATAGAPSGRSEHTAVWTGNRMIVWGGAGSSKTGGLYDPVDDSWSPTSTAGAPEGRGRHTAVWTGSEMVIWGGSQLTTGGRYDPVTDTWLPTSMSGVPEARDLQSGVWTGRRMIVWGGNDWPEENYLDTGGRYDPATDSWAETTTVGAPRGRIVHTATWTGEFMIVWGGEDTWYRYTNSGGRYIECDMSDGDGDGYSSCDGDCDDADGDIHPDAPEINDGKDNQCPGEAGHGIVDEVSGECGFHDPLDKTEYCWPAQDGATEYEVRRSSSPTMSSPCEGTLTTATCWHDVEQPLAGECFYYLTRAASPHPGSWGQGSDGLQRADVCQ